MKVQLLVQGPKLLLEGCLMLNRSKTNSLPQLCCFIQALFGQQKGLQGTSTSSCRIFPPPWQALAVSTKCNNHHSECIGIHPPISWCCKMCWILKKQIPPPQRSVKSCSYTALNQSNQNFLLQSFLAIRTGSKRDEGEWAGKISAKYETSASNPS